ncbi:hypothetical protein F2Q69_00040220 [Brassica cretica]|uniref:Uncharacterized protein n=1 Tax=Brassica cretica TaxID=69181 RepID=A0A8S9NCV3_BRACR|nr:hypothetical protein F2Q69_00040220 [Brassica cretica]
MREATFSELGFGETAASEAKMMLEEHATGWGLKRDIDDDDVESLVLTWKGHSVVFCIVLKSFGDSDPTQLVVRLVSESADFKT